MSKGVLLFAIGDNIYGRMAENMLATIKEHSPDLPVKVVKGQNTEVDVSKFDAADVVDKRHFLLTGKKFNPGFAKLHADLYTPFDETIVLDVDGVVINPLERLFEICEGYNVQYEGVGDNQWCKQSTIKNHYNIQERVELPHVSTVFQYLDNNGEALLQLARKIMEANPIPKDKMGMMWGNHKQPTYPDEIYISAALGKTKRSGSIAEQPRPIFFANEGDEIPSKKELEKEYYGIGVGGMRFSDKLKSYINKYTAGMTAEEMWSKKFSVKENLKMHD